MLKVGDEVARTSGLYQITPCTAGCETGCKTRCRWLSRRNVLLTHIDSEAELVELRDLLNREFPVEPEPQSDVIDTGDVVRHGPTGEEWVVAYVDGDHLSWVGWPPGMAAVADCTLVRKATPEERVKLLRQLANSQHHGRARASEALRHEQQPEPQSPEPDPDPDEVRRALDGYHGVHVPECVLAAARAWLRTRDLPGLAPNRVAFWDAVNQYAKACGGDTGSGTVSGARMDAVVAVERAVSFTRDTREQSAEYIDVVFTGPPGPTSGEFVECEDPSGKSIRVGEWLQRPDGYWALRIPRDTREPVTFDFQRVLAWARSEDRPKAHAAFTAGIEREVADLIEMLPERERQTALTIEQVIEACEETTLRVCRETNGWRADIGNGSATADTPEAAIQALGNAAIAKLRERHARDAAKLKALGVIP